MDTGSLVVILGVLAVGVGLSLIRRGARGAANDPGTADDEAEEAEE